MIRAAQRSWICRRLAPEDARVTYTGPSLVSTASVDSSNATVVLSATIRTSAPSGGCRYARNPGDIRKATVAFINRADNSVIAGICR